jgi:hypothetical protein
LTVTPNEGGYGHFFPTGFGSTPVYFAPDEGAPSGEVAPAGVEGTEGGEPVVTPDPAAAAAAAAASTTAPEGAAPAGAEPIPDPDDGTIPEALRPYVKQLRDEAAERRVSLKPYEDVFGKFEPEETQALLSVIGGLVRGDAVRGGHPLKAVVESILGDGSEDPTARSPVRTSTASSRRSRPGLRRRRL